MSRSKSLLSLKTADNTLAVTRRRHPIIAKPMTAMAISQRLPEPVPSLLADESSLPAWPLFSQPMKQYLIFRTHSFSQEETLSRLARAMNISKDEARLKYRNWRAESELFNDAALLVNVDPTAFVQTLERHLFLDELTPTLETLCAIRDTGSPRERIVASQTILNWISDHYRPRIAARVLPSPADPAPVPALEFHRVQAQDDGDVAALGAITVQP